MAPPCSDLAALRWAQLREPQGDWGVVMGGGAVPGAVSSPRLPAPASNRLEIPRSQLGMGRSVTCKSPQLFLPSQSQALGLSFSNRPPFSPKCC